jgi:ABC-type Zn uptake system ZnuABC Zn-binding protein ZnuA
MWQRGIIFLTLIGVLGCGVRNNNQVRVVTTIPVLADWVRQVGGERVEVHSLLQGYEDPHNFEPNPRDAKAVARAKMVVRVGLGLDEWLNGLVANAGNPRLKVVTLAEGMDIIKGNEEGHHHGIHHEGNPHIWLDPAVAKSGVQRIAAVLTELDPKGKDFYEQHTGDYLRELDSLTGVLKELVRKLKNRKFVAMHSSWPYFCRAFGLEMVATVEPLPGAEPSAKDMAELVRRMRSGSVRVIVLEPQQNPDLAATLAKETGAKVVMLCQFNGVLPGTESYLQLLEYNVRSLVGALSRD